MMSLYKKITLIVLMLVASCAVSQASQNNDWFNGIVNRLKEEVTQYPNLEKSLSAELPPSSFVENCLFKIQNMLFPKNKIETFNDDRENINTLLKRIKGSEKFKKLDRSQKKCTMSILKPYGKIYTHYDFWHLNFLIDKRIYNIKNEKYEFEKQATLPDFKENSNYVEKRKEYENYITCFENSREILIESEH